MAIVALLHTYSGSADQDLRQIAIPYGGSWECAVVMAAMAGVAAFCNGSLGVAVAEEE